MQINKIKTKMIKTFLTTDKVPDPPPVQYCSGSRIQWVR